jgi:outer membrane protein assembly factor BamE (lipoprotein component of BamABCDE complex)
VAQFGKSRSTNRMAVAVTLALVSLAGAGCTSVVDRRGFMPEDEAQTVVTAGTDTKNTVLSRLGNPSQQGVFDQQVWYYISSIDASRAFFRARTTERRIIAVTFDESDIVANVRQFGMADGRVIAYSTDRTPTRGREVTFLEQIFGSVGRAPVQLPGEDPNLPTGSGGPRRQ